MNKQTVYIPVSDLNSSELIVCNEGIENSCLDRVKIVEAFVFTPEELKPLQDIVDEGYDPYDSAHHLVVQKWLKIIENLLNK